MRRQSILVMGTVGSLVLCLGVPTLADVVTLGDLDGGHYDGLGSADHVYVDSEYLATVVEHWDNYTGPTFYRNRITGFDSWMHEQQIPCTFEYSAPALITEAWLTLVFAPTKSDFVTDGVRLEWLDAGVKYHFADYGWDQGIGTFVVGTLDLLPHSSELLDGKLNVLLFDDLCVDYAVLAINESPVSITPVPANPSGLDFPPYDPVPQPNLIPVPGAFLLGTLGMGLVSWMRRRRVV